MEAWMADELETVAVKSAETLLFKSPTIAHPSIAINDVTGALLFLDFPVSGGSDQPGWVRLLPGGLGSPVGTLVAAYHGLHPILQAGGLSNILGRITNAGYAVPPNTHEMGLLEPIQPRLRLLNLTMPDVSQLGSPVHNADIPIAAYHYPDLGVLARDTKTGDTGYVDLFDLTFHRVSESGAPPSNPESRVISSFYNTLEESGDPGSFTVPSDEFALDHVPLIGQEADNWCAAASCQMILGYYGITKTQQSIAEAMSIPADAANGGASLGNQVAAYKTLSDGRLQASSTETTLGADCVNELLAHRPVKNGIVQHAEVIAGWKASEYGPQYLIYDPLPKDQGGTHYQNPQIVYSLNFVFVRQM
jgi:hypothetical protein